MCVVIPFEMREVTLGQRGTNNQVKLTIVEEHLVVVEEHLQLTGILVHDLAHVVRLVVQHAKVCTRR